LGSPEKEEEELELPFWWRGGRGKKKKFYGTGQKRDFNFLFF
jgi:hypothetical protein